MYPVYYQETGEVNMLNREALMHLWALYEMNQRVASDCRLRIGCPRDPNESPTHWVTCYFYQILSSWSDEYHIWYSLKGEVCQQEVFGLLRRSRKIDGTSLLLTLSPVKFLPGGRPELPEVEGGKLLEAVKLACLFPAANWNYKKIQQDLGGISDEHAQDLLCAMQRIHFLIATRIDSGWYKWNPTMLQARFEEIFGVTLPNS